MSTSSDGESVMVSFAYIEGGTLQNRIAFYNFEEGKSDPDRLMGVFQKYGDTLVADVKFLEADKAVAVGDDQLLFYSLTTAAIPQENGAVEVNGEILRVVYGDEKVGIQVREDSGDVLYIYNASGKELLAFDLEGIVEDIQLTSKRVYILYNESLQIINYRGNGIFSGSVGEEVKKVVPTSSRNKLLVVDGTSLFGLRLK